MKNCNKSYTFSTNGDFFRVEETTERIGLVLSITNADSAGLKLTTIYLSPEQVNDLAVIISKYGSELEYKPNSDI